MHDVQKEKLIQSLLDILLEPAKATAIDPGELRLRISEAVNAVVATSGEVASEKRERQLL